LFATEAIEWNRLGAFQDVTLRLIAESFLPHGRGNAHHGSLDPVESLHMRSQVYVQGELANEKPALPSLASGFHVYCSAHNCGAADLIRELSSNLGVQLDAAEATPSNAGRRLHVAFGIDDLPSCHHMLVYLNDLTWTSDDESDAFASEVKQAMDADVHLLLAHEMSGIGQDGRFPCDFANFFGGCDRGSTPQELLLAGIYSDIAVGLKGWRWRQASMVMLAKAIASGRGASTAAKRDTTSTTILLQLRQLRRSTLRHLPKVASTSSEPKVVSTNSELSQAEVHSEAPSLQPNSQRDTESESSWPTFRDTLSGACHADDSSPSRTPLNARRIVDETSRAPTVSQWRRARVGVSDELRLINQLAINRTVVLQERLARARRAKCSLSPGLPSLSTPGVDSSVDGMQDGNAPRNSPSAQRV